MKYKPCWKKVEIARQYSGLSVVDLTIFTHDTEIQKCGKLLEKYIYDTQETFILLKNSFWMIMATSY